MESFYGTEIRRNTHTQKKNGDALHELDVATSVTLRSRNDKRTMDVGKKKRAGARRRRKICRRPLRRPLDNHVTKKKQKTKESARRCIPKRRRKKKRIRIPFIAGATAQRHNTERCRLANFDVTLRANQSTWIDSKPTKTKKNKCISLLWDTPLRKKPT